MKSSSPQQNTLATSIESLLEQQHQLQIEQHNRNVIWQAKMNKETNSLGGLSFQDIFDQFLIDSVNCVTIHTIDSK